MVKRLFRLFQALFSYPYKKELVKGIEKGWFPVFIRYPVYPESRYGYNGREPHPHLFEMLNKRRDIYKSRLIALSKCEDNLLRIETAKPDNSEQPYWSNPWFSGLDAGVLYGFIVDLKPKLYLEIGSGNSTKFARQAISDYGLATKIVSIDPHPREEIDSLSDEIIRVPLEKADFGIFERLEENDILFFDGSHRCFMSSDVTVFFLEILPKLPTGVLIHIHDIIFLMITRLRGLCIMSQSNIYLQRCFWGAVQSMRQSCQTSSF